MPPVSMATPRTALMRSREPAVDALAGAGHGASDDVGVAAEPLGGRLHHQIDAELDGPTQVWRGERVVHHHDRAVAVSQLSEAREVGHHDGGIGDGLGIEQSRGGSCQLGLDSVEVGRIDEDDLHAEPSQHALHERPGCKRCDRRPPGATAGWRGWRPCLSRMRTRPLPHAAPRRRPPWHRQWGSRYARRCSRVARNRSAPHSRPHPGRGTLPTGRSARPRDPAPHAAHAWRP